MAKKGVIRYWAETDFGGLLARSGTVIKTSKINIPVRRGYTGCIAPPDLVRETHVLVKKSSGGTSWVALK